MDEAIRRDVHDVIGIQGTGHGRVLSSHLTTRRWILWMILYFEQKVKVELDMTDQSGQETRLSYSILDSSSPAELDSAPLREDNVANAKMRRTTGRLSRVEETGHNVGPPYLCSYETCLDSRLNEAIQANAASYRCPLTRRNLIRLCLQSRSSRLEAIAVHIHPHLFLRVGTAPRIPRSTLGKKCGAKGQSCRLNVADK